MFSIIEFGLGDHQHSIHLLINTFYTFKWIRKQKGKNGAYIYLTWSTL